MLKEKIMGITQQEYSDALERANDAGIILDMYYNDVTSDITEKEFYAAKERIEAAQRVIDCYKAEQEATKVKIISNEARNEIERQEVTRKTQEQIYKMDCPFRVDIYPLEANEPTPDYEDTELMSATPLIFSDSRLPRIVKGANDPTAEQDDFNDDDAFRHVAQVRRHRV